MDDDLRYVYPERDPPLRMRETLVRRKRTIFRCERERPSHASRVRIFTFGGFVSRRVVC